MANAGLDTANAIKQAAEFGLTQGGTRLAALLFTLAEVKGLGLKAAQGLTLTEGWYWDQSDENRAFAKKFQEKTGRMPNMIHVGTYSAVTQYLKAIQKAGTDATEPVAKALHEMPVEDVFAKKGKVLPNGRMVYDMYLFQVKKPEESKSEWDMYKQLAKVPGDEAYPQVADSGCQAHAVRSRKPRRGWREPPRPFIASGDGWYRASRPDQPLPPHHESVGRSLWSLRNLS